MASKHSPSSQGYANKPFEAHVHRVNPQNEKLQVDSVTGPDDVSVSHPLLSTNAWIRALPEQGARILTQATAGGTMRRVVVGYYSRAAAELIGRYQAGVGLYRPLKAGEWDLLTPGAAYIHGAQAGRLQLRGGLVHLTADPQKLHLRSRAPTFRRELHEKLDHTLLNEERFGVVVRHTKLPKEKHRWLRAPGSSPDLGVSAGTPINRQAFAQEYLRLIGRSGNRLALRHEGDLFDQEGGELKHSKTSRRLRNLTEYYNTDGDVQYQYEVDDEKGATAWTGNADRIDVTQKAAGLTAEMKSITATISQAIAMTAGSTIDMKAQSTGRYSGATQTFLGPDPAPIDQAMLGTTFNATVMSPLLGILIGWFSAAGAMMETLSLLPLIGPPPLPTGFVMKALAVTTLGVGSALVPLVAALVPSLSVNVKVSK